MGICIKEALRRIEAHIKKVSFEILPIESCVGRFCAQEISATISLPPYNNSAMDGFGVKLSDGGKEVKIVGDVFAGSSNEPHIKVGEVIKIMTGARVPASVEAVVPIENTQKIDENTIQLPQNIKHNQHIRFVGEDIEKDQIIVKDGDAINFATITVLASQGISHIKVYRQPKVSVFTSGEELKLHYESIKEYQIYNSNTPTLLARIKEFGCDGVFSGMAKDSVASLVEMIENSLHSDLIITTGGVSVGEADFTHEAFKQVNMEIIFDGITIKPGKPTVFGKIGNTYILNLPGNPLAAALIFEAFGTVILQKLLGSRDIYHNYIVGKLSQDLPNKKGRTTLIPGYFNGEYFTPSAKRLPGMVNTLNGANSMIILNKFSEFIQKDETVKIVPISWRFFTDTQKDYFN